MGNLSLRNKILFMTTVPLVVSVLLIILTVLLELNSLGKSQTEQLRTQMLHDKQEALRSYLDYVYASVSDLYEGSEDNSSIRQEALSRINNISYGENGDGYVFVYSYDGTNLANRPKPSIVGKNLLDLKDKNGVYLIKDLITSAKNGGGFVEYVWHKPSIKTEAPKLSYAIGLEKWGWMIGTGFYIDDIDTEVLSAKKTLDSKITEILMIMAFIAIVILAVIIFSSIRFSNKTYAQLGNEPSSLDNIAKQIAIGNLNVGQRKESDVGVYDSMLRMRDDLQIRIESDKLKAAEIGRIKQALDKVSSSVMMADNNYNIIYFNDSLLEMFKKAESQLQEAIPDFDINNLIGNNIDCFHKEPKHQRRILDNLEQTYQSDVSVGELHLRIIANPVIDSNGTRIGTVVEWSNRTQEVATEQEVANIVEAARHGDLTRRIDLDGKEEFFLALSSDVNALVGVAENVIDDASGVLGSIAHGDLTQKIETNYDGSFEQLKENINDTVEKLTDILSEIKAMTSDVEVSAMEIAAGNADLGRRTDSQASQLEETAASMEEMTSTINQNADHSVEAEQIAKQSLVVAENGGEIINQAIVSMKEVEESSHKIADIIRVIDEIAFQTNLLALNAAVEAARAGEQGRGFAVVAGEVRSLAQKTASSAKEIKELILDSNEKVEQGNSLVKQSGESLTSIVESVDNVAGLISQIALANKEQAQGISQVNVAVTTMDEMTQQNAALVEEAAATSEGMSHKANNLKQLVSFFKV